VVADTGAADTASVTAAGIARVVTIEIVEGTTAMITAIVTIEVTAMVMGSTATAAAMAITQMAITPVWTPTFPIPSRS
jgi:hypothetical protein